MAAEIPFPVDQVEYLVATAARAPSVHNTQPWLFRAGTHAIELHGDPGRRLLVDPTGREMLISCGAALFGLRLAIRSLGYRPVVRLLPDPATPHLLARVTLASGSPMSGTEREMLRAILHRHTHRGAFEPRPLPTGLLAALQAHGLAEGAALVFIHDSTCRRRLAALAAEADSKLHTDPHLRAEVRCWTRDINATDRDGVPAHAFSAIPRRQADRLPQRDFDLGRGVGRLPQATLDEDGTPAEIAVLLTPGDTETDWLLAGQALHRVLLHAATEWVFAGLDTELLEVLPRTVVRRELAVPGMPQMLIQFGRAGIAHATARRPPGELLLPGLAPSGRLGGIPPTKVPASACE